MFHWKCGNTQRDVRERFSLVENENKGESICEFAMGSEANFSQGSWIALGTNETNEYIYTDKRREMHMKSTIMVLLRIYAIDFTIEIDLRILQKFNAAAARSVLKLFLFLYGYLPYYYHYYYYIR